MSHVGIQGGPKTENTALCLLQTRYCLSAPQNRLSNIQARCSMR